MEDASGFVVEPSSLPWAALSATVFFVTLVVSARKGTLGPTVGRRFNWTTFASGVFLAALLYSMNFALSETATFASAPFIALQMMGMERDTPMVVNGNVSELAFFLFRYYGIILFLCAPGATILAIGSYLSRFFLIPKVRLWSRFRQTYVFSDLNTRTLALAASVRNHYESRRTGGGLLGGLGGGLKSGSGGGRMGGASLVFASIGDDADEALLYEARSLGATCVERDASTIWQSLSRRNTVHIVLESDNDVSDITRASALQRQIMTYGQFDKTPPLRIYSVTSLYGAEALLGVGEVASGTGRSIENVGAGNKGAGGRGAGNRSSGDKPTGGRGAGGAGHGRTPDVRVMRIDWTRSLVERTLNQYPLFLAGDEPTNETHGSVCLGTQEQRYLEWEHEMYSIPHRHVLVVGCGRVGMEFVRLALSYGKIGACDGDAPMSFRFDVFDAEADPVQCDKCLSETQFVAECPEALQDATCEFHLASALGPEFHDFVERHAQTITYVFVALGDSLLTARASMQIRTMLERQLVRRCSSLPQGRREYARATRPVIVAVINVDELSESLADATEDGFAYRIHTVGSDAQMYSYDSIFHVGDHTTEYMRRSSRASKAHQKYRLFAFVRSDIGRRAGLQDLAIDWSGDLSRPDRSSRYAQTEDAIAAYNEFVRSTPALGPGPNSHEWLLKMEHDRWSAYLRAEGFRTATARDVETFFATGQPDQRHRLNIARLHPCLVPFDELPEVDKVVDGLYADCETQCGSCPMSHACKQRKKTCEFSLVDDKYLSIDRIDG